MPRMSKKALIYCDGSSIGNPGPGGWGAIVRFSEGTVKEIGGFESHTTNNRMELMAAIQALELVRGKEETIELRTDSSYVINGITKWVSGWERNGWKTKAKGEVLNQDLWESLRTLDMGMEVVWKYVPGHAGILGNERVDVIAQSFARKENIKLYNGEESRYEIDLEKSTPQKPFYISYVDDVFDVHETWVSCEKRVKGKQGTRFKKVSSKEEMQKVALGWKVSMSQLKKFS